MDALKTIGAGGQPAVIFSDSASVLAAVEGGRSRHPWIQVIEAELDRTSATLCWIPGHANIRGNEEADRLAGSAEELEIQQIAVPAEDIKRWAKTKLRLSWEMEWLNERDLQLRRVKPTTLPGKDRESQAEQRTLTRLRIGHTRYTHAGLFTNEIKDCDTCGVRITVPHILTECRAYDGHRNAAGLSSSLYEILNNNHEAETKLIKFLRSTELFTEI